MNHSFFLHTPGWSILRDIWTSKSQTEGSVIALSALYNCQVLAFSPSSGCLQRDTLPLARYLSCFFRSDVEVDQSCAWLNWTSSSLWSQGNNRLCMLEYFFYCISQTSAACELANARELLVCCTGEKKLLGTCQFFLIPTALPPEATKNTAELRRKMPQTHLYIYILCCCGQAAIITYSALQKRADKKVTPNIARSRARVSFQVTVPLWGLLPIFYFTSQITLLLLWNPLCCYSWSRNQQFTCSRHSLGQHWKHQLVCFWQRL